MEFYQHKDKPVSNRKEIASKLYLTIGPGLE